jgi:hypothetical protein
MESVLGDDSTGLLPKKHSAEEEDAVMKDSAALSTEEDDDMATEPSCESEPELDDEEEEQTIDPPEVSVAAAAASAASQANANTSRKKKKSTRGQKRKRVVKFGNKPMVKRLFDANKEVRKEERLKKRAKVLSEEELKQREAKEREEEAREESHLLQVEDERLRLSDVNFPDLSLRVDADLMKKRPGMNQSIPEGFIKVNQDEIAAVQNVWKESHLVTNAFNMIADAILCGGVIIDVPVVQETDEGRRLTNVIMTKFTRDVLRSLLMYGIAPVASRRDRNNINIPVVVDVALTSWYVRHHAFRHCDYLFTVRSETTETGFSSTGFFDSHASGASIGGRPKDRFIPGMPLTGIYVFRLEDVRVGGLISSPVRRCANVFVDYQANMDLVSVAQARLANPSIVTRHDTASASAKDPITLTGSTAEGISAEVSGAFTRQITGADLAQRRMAARKARLMNRGVPKELIGARSKARSYVVNSVNQSVPGIPHVQLEDGDHLERQLVPVAPDAEKLRRALREDISETMGIPYAVFSSAENGAHTVGSTAAGMAMYEQRIAYLRQMMHDIVHQVYTMLHTADHMRDVIAQTDTTFEGVLSKVRPTVTIPGVPAYDRMLDLLEREIIDYGYFRKWLSQSTGIPLEGIKKTWSLKKFVNDSVPDPPPESASSSSSSPSKATKKTTTPKPKKKPASDTPKSGYSSTISTVRKGAKPKSAMMNN